MPILMYTELGGTSVTALTCAQRHGWFPVGLGALGLAISLELRVTCHLAFFYDEVLASGMQRALATHTADCPGPSHFVHRMRPVATCQLTVFTGRKPCLLFQRRFHKVGPPSGFEIICTLFRTSMWRLLPCVS